MSETSVFQPAELMRRLNAGRVHFVVIGGLAAQAHGSPSATFDLDIVPSWDSANLVRLEHVLTEIAAVRSGLPEDAPPMPPLDARTLLAGAVFTLTSRLGRLDVLANPDPGLDFDRLMQSAEARELFGDHVHVASLDDLIAMKRAAGRPKDRVELEILGALREEIDRGNASRR
ncbi:MAG: hypothetical protein AABZ33_14100 [Chloroflexota bacterium]